MLIFYMCSLSSKHHFIFYAYSLKMDPHIGHCLSSTIELLRLVPHFGFLLHFLFSVLELILIITNWLRIHYRLAGPQKKISSAILSISRHWSSKRVQNVRKTVLIHSEQSQIVPRSPNLTFSSQVGPLPCYISTNCSRHKNTLSRGHLDYKWAHMTFP